MVIDTLKNASKYYSLHPSFAKAFEFLQQNDLAKLADGVSETQEGMVLIVNTAQGKTIEASLESFECHDKNIDIQVCVKGLEMFGWKPREKCIIPKGAYNPEKDVRFYSDAPDLFFQLSEGQFVVFFPEDVHAPMISDGEIKKVVIKIKI
jgi:YhcH/YjgK/YiaL family protein